MTTIACLHGFMGAPEDWDEIRELLPEYEVAALDIQPAESWQTGIDGLCQELPKQSVLVGYSMGARLALACALRLRATSPSHEVLVAHSFNRDPEEVAGTDPAVTRGRCRQLLAGSARWSVPRALPPVPSNPRHEHGMSTPTASSGSRLNEGRLSGDAMRDSVKQCPKIDALVFVSGCPGLSESDRNARWEHDLQVAARLETESRSDFLAWWYRQPVFSSLPPRLVQEEIQRKLKRNGTHWSQLLTTFSVGRQPNFWPQLDQLDIPVLAVAGQHDSKYVDISHRIGEACPNARVEIVSGAGHMVHREQPDAFTGILRDFFASSRNTSVTRTT